MKKETHLADSFDALGKKLFGLERIAFHHRDKTNQINSGKERGNRSIFRSQSSRNVTKLGRCITLSQRQQDTECNADHAEGEKKKDNFKSEVLAWIMFGGEYFSYVTPDKKLRRYNK